MKSKINVAIVGLRFGGCFPDIYLAHPDIGTITICDSNEETLNAFGDKYGIARRTTRFEELLTDKSIDAIHLVTPIPSHGKLSLQVLEAGKHCACTVPMATTLEEIFAIVEAQKRTGLNYMMMETAAYTYHCLYVQELIKNNEIGRIQFLRGAHYQDMTGWPSYWMGLPPMHYSTHAIAPLLKLANTRAKKVTCFGSGLMSSELQVQYGNPFPIETAHFELDQPNLMAEVTRNLFETARQYGEIFSVLGDKASFEWNFEHEAPMITRMGAVEKWMGRTGNTERVLPPSFRDRLPEEIQKFDQHQIIPDPANPHQSVMQGGNHQGSHPHLVHEFVRSIIEERKPAIDAVIAADWTAPGICAHQSAMTQGESVVIPSFV